MRCVIPQITWNSCQQILSLDFDPSCKGENGFYRLVTVGADTNLLVWHLSQPGTLKPELKCATELNRHQKAVNVVRFSPDGNWIASGDDDAYVIIWRNDRKSPEEENWTVEKSLRKHLGDVTDLSWSLDSTHLLSASIDSTAVLWDVKKGASKYIWTEHSGYVQGVALDPSRELAATISIDRTLRFFDTKSGKLKSKVNKYVGWVAADDASVEESLPKPNESLVSDSEEVKKPAGPPQGNHIFQGDDLATFCRRLCFSPGGEFLMVPAGAVPAEKQSAPESEDPGSPSGDSARKRIKLKPAEKPVASNNAVIVFCRNDLTIPCAVIPTDTSYSVACRFNPLYYKREDRAFEYSSDLLNPVKKDERRIYCSGKLNLGREDVGEDILFDYPYRLVYAIATNNSVMIGTTDKPEPVAVVRNIHFARLTDLAWSPDGKVLVTASTDGYCSIITLDDGELGEVAAGTLADPTPANFPVPLKEVKVKEPKQKGASAKKEKTPGGKKRKEPKTTPQTSEKKKTKTPKSASRTPKDSATEPKKRAKMHPIKLLLENQPPKTTPVSEKSEEGSKKVDAPASDVIREIRLPEAQIPKPIAAVVVEEDPEEVQEEEENLATSVSTGKFVPQRNTLDCWLLKGRKSVSSSSPTSASRSLPKSVKKLKPRKAQTSSDPIEVIQLEDDDGTEGKSQIQTSSAAATESENTKLVAPEPAAVATGTSTSSEMSVKIDPKKSSDLISEHSETPVISSAASGPSTEAPKAPLLPSVTPEPTSVPAEGPIQPSAESQNIPSPTQPSKPKQPRRVQLITLSTPGSTRGKDE